METAGNLAGRISRLSVTILVFQHHERNVVLGQFADSLRSQPCFQLLVRHGHQELALNATDREDDWFTFVKNSKKIFCCSQVLKRHIAVFCTKALT